jgi:hypothetical protein
MDKNTGKPIITIHADGISRTTNVGELYQKLSNTTPMDEAAKMAAFVSLDNTINTVKRAAVEVTEVRSEILGTLQQDEQFDDWWHSEPKAVPYLDGLALTFTYIDFNPAEDEAFIAEADETIRNFLTLTAIDRLAASAHVYRNCMKFLDAIGYNEEDDALWKIKDRQEIWQHVRYNQCYVSREPYEDHEVYLRLSCECDWEPEHGLQLVFNRHGKLVRVSAEDGHVLGYQGDGMIS